MLTTLSDAIRSTCGGKAATLGVLLRAGVPVPEGFVVPASSVAETVAGTRPEIVAGARPEVEAGLRSAITRALDLLGDPVVAVRSSATDEDSRHASAAGQYESVVGVRGSDGVCAAVTTCWDSARAARVADYRRQTGQDNAPGMAVLVQRVIEAEVSGVLFTPQRPGGSTRIEAAWGLGLAVVSGTVTPDSYDVTADGDVDCVVGSKRTRIDLTPESGGVGTSLVGEQARTARTLQDSTVRVLAGMGRRIAAMLGGPQDIEWAIADDAIWILQARPITAAVPASRTVDQVVPSRALAGVPGSPGLVTATARIVGSPDDFHTVRPGDVVICPCTDPAWTPLFTIAAGVVTETGGALSHAAIVAREYGIPAALAIPHATTHIRSGDRVALDGTAGTITVL